VALLARKNRADVATAGQHGRRGTRELSPHALGVVMNLPAIFLLLLVLAYPVGYAGYLSLHRVGIAQLRRGVFPWNDWENYTRLFEDPLFALALKNTIVFTVLVVVVEVILAIGVALLLNRTSLWTSRLARLLILIPYGVPPITNGLIWSFMYSFQFGFLNRVLFSLGLINDPVNWAGNPNTALYAVAVAYIWRTLPFAVLIIHAALQGIPRELHEAAIVDGGSAWQRFRWITLPLLTPVIIVILILRTSFAFAVFEEILAITQGGPGDASFVAAWYSYKLTFSPPNNIGMGAASAYVLALLVGLFAIAYVRLIYRRIA
jgi:ABC-type sugar transport system permease subunit